MTNKLFLQSIYDTIRSMGIVQSQYEFGRLCGRKASWLSCAKSVDRPMSTAALVALAVNLERLPPERIPRNARPLLKQLIISLWVLVQENGGRGAR